MSSEVWLPHWRDFMERQHREAQRPSQGTRQTRELGFSHPGRHHKGQKWSSRGVPDPQQQDKP